MPPTGAHRGLLFHRLSSDPSASNGNGLGSVAVISRTAAPSSAAPLSCGLLLRHTTKAQTAAQLYNGVVPTTRYTAHQGKDDEEGEADGGKDGEGNMAVTLLNSSHTICAPSADDIVLHTDWAHEELQLLTDAITPKGAGVSLKTSNSDLALIHPFPEGSAGGQAPRVPPGSVRPLKIDDDVDDDGNALLPKSRLYRLAIASLTCVDKGPRRTKLAVTWAEELH